MSAHTHTHTHTHTVFLVDVMTTREVDVELHAFLTLTLDGN